jgi:hypothetical protein
MLKNIVHGVSFWRDKIPVIFEKQGNQYYCYDGEQFGYITKERKQEIKSMKTEYILIEKDKRETKKSMQDEYKNFIRDADELKKQTNGIVNMYRSGSDVKTALCLAYKYMTEKNLCSEEITRDEYEWLEDAAHGSIVFSEKYSGCAWKYDLNSAYPSIYSSKYFTFPIKQGEFKTLTKEEFNNLPFYQIGIYKVRISYPDRSEKWKKIFRLNFKNTYTHIDIGWAKKLNLKIELIEDGKPNFLFYSRDKCVTGSECFGEYVKLLYPLRKNPIISARCKSLLRCLWGALCQRNYRKLTAPDPSETNIPFEIYETKTIIAPIILDDNYENLQFLTIADKSNAYETGWARLKPFLLAKGRVKIAEYILPHWQHVKRCHTDSMTSDLPLAVHTSMELGMMKYEGFSPNCNIKNSITVTGEFFTTIKHEHLLKIHCYLNEKFHI